MALEPSLWGTLPMELLHLVFVNLSVVKIGQLRVLSKEWKWNIDYKHSEFNRVFDATTHLKKFATMSWNYPSQGSWTLYDMQTDKCHVLDNTAFNLSHSVSADGGLFCSSQWTTHVSHFQIVVRNPLTKKKKKLPPLLDMGSGNYNVYTQIMKFTMDRKTKEYKVYFVGNFVEIDGNSLTTAQVYDSHVNAWSVVESREVCIIGGYSKLYNCVDGNLQQLYLEDMGPGFYKGFALINDHLFVLHRENILQKYCIFEYHLPKKATAWVKLRVHDCDPSICKHLKEDYKISLLACNGFLLLYSSRSTTVSRVCLYNLLTCVWHNLIFLVTQIQMLLEINWSALP